MKHLSVLIKPASSLCNLRCKYCFYADVSDARKIKSYGIMNDSTMKKLIDNVYRDLEENDIITFAFQGGEPTLAGIDFFRLFVEYVNTKNSKVKVQYVIQTNGTLINEEWCQFLKENRFIVGLSIDCMSNNHNENRVDANQKGTFNQVIKTKEMFDKNSIDYNILCVLTNNIARYPKKVFSFIIDNNIKYIQFIPCLNDLDCSNESKHALKPERFSSFYKQIYSLWEEEYKKGNYISIGLIDNIANLLTRGRTGTCGMSGQCQIQYVIEADGGVYPCDFYVLDEYKIGDITKDSLKEIFNNKKAQQFINNKEELTQICKNCEYVRLCNGGCKRMQKSMYINKDNTYCGYNDVLAYILNSLNRII
ncbi:SPASM domain-containing protein [Clostridioides sp. ZZV14-6154]|uniref:radical SAM/SPASM domain-containing protein n=1 Tax=Clostridioides sp. ZZV14-6154 TaxID=2811495 RepID=UPI001D12D0D4|nr:SPASM domain-containing protein [Clostridioides sp. ZZV14-6154]